ncbi:hypothetical protein [Pseudomonas mandelii]|uniref:hypothetical protein n=1 Tax=Pseudomonas mandelii TaxID=75612 RepID=UPI00224ADC8F|nr:hypothetical protein [Pseudomonas mandelii]MCX2898774.1 hypothetical protein [Pseudomonas mandelii]
MRQAQFPHTPESTVGAWLASDDARKIAIAGKPGSYGFVSNPNPRTPRSTVGAWLASDDIHKIAIAGKPGSYGFVPSPIPAYTRINRRSLACQR